MGRRKASLGIPVPRTPTIMLSCFLDIVQNHNEYENAHIRRVSWKSAMTSKHGIKALSSILDGMKPTRSAPTDSCSEYDPNDYSELGSQRQMAYPVHPIRCMF